jgi:hypothetical protein
MRKKPRESLSDPSQQPFAARELLRRRAIASKVMLPAEPPEARDDQRAQVPKRGGTRP